MSDAIFYAMLACTLAQIVLAIVVLRLHKEEVLILERQIAVLKRDRVAHLEGLNGPSKRY